MEKFSELKRGHIGIVEKEQETSWDIAIIGVCLCATYTLQWMYLGMRRQAHITLLN